MEIEFDAVKDAANLAKHGVSLARAREIRIDIYEIDKRFNLSEVRYRAFGRLNGELYCMAFTYRGEVVRVISLRRAHQKEYRRHVSR